MLDHSNLWRTIDRLAAIKACSPSALAKLAGLDATAFNQSKRMQKTKAGIMRPRWPSMESVARLLQACGISFDEFAALLAGRPQQAYVPVISMAQAGEAGFFNEEGLPQGAALEELAWPMQGASFYALEVRGDSMQPILRAGDKLLVSPQAEVRAGDRVVVRVQNGQDVEVLVKVLLRQSQSAVTLRSLNADYADRLVPRVNLLSMARVLWISQ